MLKILLNIFDILYFKTDKIYSNVCYFLNHLNHMELNFIIKW